MYICSKFGCDDSACTLHQPSVYYNYDAETPENLEHVRRINGFVQQSCFKIHIQSNHHACHRCGWHLKCQSRINIKNAVVVHTPRGVLSTAALETALEGRQVCVLRSVRIHFGQNEPTHASNPP